MVQKQFQKGPKMIQNSSKIDQILPKWSKKIPKQFKIVPKLSPNGPQNSPKMVPKLSQSYAKIVSKWSLNGPKWSQNGSKMALKLSQNSLKIFRVIDLEVINLNSKFEPYSSLNGYDKLLVQFQTTMEAVAPLANDPIMFGRPIGSFRDLENQNPSIISDSID